MIGHATTAYRVGIRPGQRADVRPRRPGSGELLRWV